MPTISETLARAVQHHQAGRLHEAEQLYRQILALEPCHPDAQHLLGVIASQTGQHQLAVEFISRAIQLNATEPAFHGNLGNAFLALGKLDDAVTSYRRALDLKPDFGEAHTNLGNAFLAQKQLNDAVNSYGQALALNPDDVRVHLGLGAVYHGQGKLTEAAASYSRALELKPDLAEAHYNLGTVLQAHGKLDEAVACYNRALERRPDYAEAYNNLGTVFNVQGKPEEAIGCCRRALELKPDYDTAHYNLGNAFQKQGKLDDAVAHYRQALALNPDFAEAHNNLGNSLRNQGKPEDAVACFRRALALNPDLSEAHSNIGNALVAQGRPDEAVVSFRSALELKPNHAEVHNNLGAAFQDQGKLEEAVACFHRALELKPDYAEAHNNLGNAFKEQRKLDEAAACFRQALELNPDYSVAHYNQSALMLQRGDFERGWPEHEWRWKTKQLVEREFSQPVWDGDPLEERTILLHAEQGLGDTIQFVRYAALVKKQNEAATVIVECQRPLEKLLANCPGIDRFIAQGDDVPPFDIHSPLLSLPSIFNTAVETIPTNVPYLFAEPALVAQWRERLSNVSGLRIGISWQVRTVQGALRHRNIPLEHFGTLAQLKGISLVSLQKSEGRDELLSASERLPILNLGPDFDTVHGAFMDTAAIMKNLDLVITSDTSIPHLAGALGVPVWLALPYVPDWRWLLDRSDSPWYPTMRLFRQRRAGEWAGVFDDIRTALKELMLPQ